MEFKELLEYVNEKLAEGNNLTQIAKGLGKNESTVRKRLNKEGYRRSGNKFVLNPDTTSSTTVIKENKKENIIPNTTCSTTKEIGNVVDEIDMSKLKLLLDNVDNLLRLIPNNTSSTTRIIRN